MKKSYALFVAGLAMSLSATAVTKTADKTVSALEAQEMYSASQLSISNRVSNRPLKAAPMKAAGVRIWLVAMKASMTRFTKTTR